MFVRRPVPIALAIVALTATLASAQGPAAAGPPISMDDAVRLALAHNQALRAERLSVDIAKADEITAALKPNPSLSLGVDGLTVFTPTSLNGTFWKDSAQYSAGLDYLFERGGKRDNRVLTAKDTTDVTTRTVADAERQLLFQTAQAFVNVQLAKSTLDLAQQDLTSYQQTVDTSQAKLNAGTLAEGDFKQIRLQLLTFQQDVSAARLSVIQSKAALRQLLGYDNVPADFDVTGDFGHPKVTVTLQALQQDALATRPDLLSAQSGLKLATDQVTLEVSNRARDIAGNVTYSRNAFGAVSALGVGLSFDLQVHNRNQGNIAHARVAVDQAREQEAAARTTVLTDVEGAFAQYQTNDQVLTLFESGYLNDAKESLDIATYVFQSGNGSLLTLLDAERTYRTTQLAYRQALAAYLTSLYQLNFVVGRQVVHP